ncbi:hypothetical protein H4S14_002299 [Agrobacterium vitis]|nr:hypothetical protein [Agrobacterium vitis]MBE1438549.1 hypothetical protein [Agrobacterium vitis]
MTDAVVFDRKFVIVLRDDMLFWQKLNVTAFLTSGIVGARSEIIGEAYQDAAANSYYPLCIQPIVILSADRETMATIHKRSLQRQVQSSLYIEEMFVTGDDVANRAVFAQYDPETANVVGIAIHADKKSVDKITKGAKMHP